MTIAGESVSDSTRLPEPTRQAQHDWEGNGCGGVLAESGGPCPYRTARSQDLTGNGEQASSSDAEPPRAGAAAAPVNGLTDGSSSNSVYLGAADGSGRLLELERLRFPRYLLSGALLPGPTLVSRVRVSAGLRLAALRFSRWMASYTSRR